MRTVDNGYIIGWFRSLIYQKYNFLKTDDSTSLRKHVLLISALDFEGVGRYIKLSNSITRQNEDDLYKGLLRSLRILMIQDNLCF